MKKEPFYKIVIILLLVLNFGILGFFWLRPGMGPGQHPEGPDRLIFERLKLDDKQKEQFDGLKHEHHSKMMKIQTESGWLHDKLFQLLKHEPVDTSARNVLIQQLSQTDKEKELVTFEHFQKLRGILHPDQVKNFDDFVEELSRYLLSPRHGKPGPGH